mgnify:CR=1 FL=1
MIISRTRGETIYDTSIPPLPLSREIARDLKGRGMKFLGETTVHAFLQAAGVICAHGEECYLGRAAR